MTEIKTDDIHVGDIIAAEQVRKGTTSGTFTASALPPLEGDPEQSGPAATTAITLTFGD